MTKDETFELVRSLAQNEKRSFRLLAKLTEGEKNYMRVFSAMESMKVYDEQRLVKRLEGTRINLSHEKKYLQKQILKSLRLYHSETNVQYKLRTLITDTEILVNKWLYSQAEKAARKALELAEVNERLHYASSALYYLDMIYTRKDVSGKLYDESKEFMLKQRSVQQSMLNVTELRIMINELTYYSKRYGNTVSSKEKSRLLNMLTHPLLAEKIKFVSGHETIAQIHLKGFIYYRLGNIEREAEMRLRAINFYENIISKGQFISIKNLISEISNYIHCKIELKQFDGLEKYFSKFNSLKKIIPEDTLSLLEGVTLRDKLKYYSLSGRTGEGSKLVASVNSKGIPKLHSDHQLQINYYSALLFFNAGDHKTSARIVKSILDEEHEHSLDYFIAASRILQLMNYYEIKDFELLHYRAISVKRSMESRKQLRSFERALLNFFIKAEVDQSKSGFQKLYGSLKKGQKNKKEKSAIQELDVMGWIEGKLK